MVRPTLKEVLNISYKTIRLSIALVGTFMHLLSGMSGIAQEAVPLVNPPPVTAQKDGRMEVEQVDIGRTLVIPSAIHRPSGKFILVLANKTPNPSASFVLDPGDAAEGTLSPTPILNFPGKTSAKRQIAGLLNLATGIYYLKAAPDGHILCTFTIE
jgi:hypothetical protein